MNDTSCRPPSGETYLAIGQDLFSIQEYVSSQYNASLHRGSTLPPQRFHPAATMVYTDIQTLRGLDHPADYGSGIEYADGLLDSFGGGLQIGLWLNGTQGCDDILTGNLDANLHQLFEYLEHAPAEKVFLRVGYEFDNPSFGYSDEPESFALAFRSMVDACEVHFKKCRQKVAFVWHSWGAPKVVELARFYPGDQYVDWVGISLFQQLYPWARNTEEGEFSGGTMEQVTEVLEFATARDKPIMIAESTPFFGMDLAEQDPSILQQYNLTVHDVDIWDLWFQPTLDLIEQYDIGMWSYINCDWNSQPMWQGIGFGDTRLASSPRVMEQWMDQVLDSERFTNHIHCHPHEHSHEHSHDHPHEHDDHDRDHEHTTPSFESLALTEKDIMIFGRKATYFLPIMYLIAIAIFALSCYKRCITKRYAGYHTLGESESSFSYDGDQSTLANGGVDTMTAVD